MTVGVPMSTASTGLAQHRRLRAAGLSVAALPVLRDVDLPADAAAVAALIPGSRFARCWAGVLAGSRAALGAGASHPVRGLPA